MEYVDFHRPSITPFFLGAKKARNIELNQLRPMQQSAARQGEDSEWQSLAAEQKRSFRSHFHFEYKNEASRKVIKKAYSALKAWPFYVL